MVQKLFLHFCIHLATLWELTNAEPLVGKEVVPARENEFPFFVTLSSSSDISNKEEYFCGGTLVSKRHVITSEHCVDGEDYNVTLIVNPANFQSRTIYKVQSWITYDDWAKEQNIVSEENDNDIAVITLSEDVKDVKPAIISKLKHEGVIDKKVVAAGWGFIDEINRVTPDSLMKVYMQVLNYTQYRRNMIALFGRPSIFRLNFYYTSADPPAVIACGDSGGPLMLASNKEVIGIHDSSCDVVVNDDNPYATSRHISLDYYRKFIEDVVKN